MHALLRRVRATTSWSLLSYLITFEEARSNPVFVRETARRPIWQGAVVRLRRATGALLALSGAGCYVTVILIFYLRNLLVLLIPVLVLWTMLLVLTLAPIIAQERAQRTWETLRTTPVPVDYLVLGKASGALWWLRDLIRLLGGAVVLASLGVGLVSMVLSSSESNSNPYGIPAILLCMGALLLPVVTAGLFIMDRAQQFLLIILAGVSVSAASHSARGAILTTSGVVFTVWLLDLAFPALVLASQGSGSLVSSFLALGTLGPVVGYVSTFSLTEALGISVLTLLLRELAVYGLWRWTVRSAADL